MSEKIKSELRRAVAEYYRWHGESHVSPVRFVQNRDEYELLLVRFMTAGKVEMSSLMTCQEWADGHWDVSEVRNTCRKYEGDMIEDFSESSGMEIAEDESGKHDMPPAGPRDCSMCMYYSTDEKYCSRYNEMHLPSDGESCPGWACWESR